MLKELFVITIPSISFTKLTFWSSLFRDGVNITSHMIELAKVKRFSMTLMFMSGSDKEGEFSDVNF